jgi:hypothetical protein
LLAALAMTWAGCGRVPLTIGDEDAGGGTDVSVEQDAADHADAGFSETEDHAPMRSCAERFKDAPRSIYDATQPPACIDGKDNDGDGFIDDADLDCTSPYDNDESSFAIRTGTDEEDFYCRRDCFFDGNVSQGDDRCSYSPTCDPANPGEARRCSYVPGRTCEAQTDGCLAACLPKTPNGCDCFGCCALSRGAGAVTVLLSTYCDSEHLDDPVRCPRCTQQPSCLNPCERCERCFGGVMPEPGCAPSGRCAPGVTPCGPGGVDACSCPGDTYCVTGCCVPL